MYEPTTKHLEWAVDLFLIVLEALTNHCFQVEGIRFHDNMGLHIIVCITLFVFTLISHVQR